ncbi:MAG: LysR substrate-binding domain-containing protein [Neisseria sp.]|nr:LysR substrate-binding domain-containing protein [Neisseria sp.]
MELRHLRYFVAVANEASFTRAAQRLYIAQPSLSQQIKQLEEEVGVPLLQRHGKALCLTEEGEVFLQEARKTLGQAQKAINAARQVANRKTAKLKIGFVPVAEISVFPEVLPLLKQQQPNMQIEFHTLTCKEQLGQLHADSLDIALSRHCIADEEIESHLLFEEDLHLLLPATHPLAAYETVPVSKLNGCDFVLSDPEASFELNRLSSHFLAKHKIVPQHIHYSRNILFNISSVGMGLGVSIVPEYVKNLVNERVVIRQTDKALPKIALYLNHKTRPSSQVKCFADLSKQHFAELRKRNPL